MSVELTIDGRKVRGEPGQTVLEVAEANGIHIPTLCHHPLLPASGACRMCIVDVGRKDRLEASCTLPISDGMNVETGNERVIEARRTVLELMLSAHPADCMTCEQNGRCELQDLAYELGIEMEDLTFKPTRLGRQVDDSSPAITYDPDLCILCGRCVAACNEIRNHSILNYQNRGYDTVVIAGLGELLIDSGCVNCGECVQVCPTGSLSEKPSRFKGRWWELEKQTTTCPFCGVGCTLEVYTKDGEIVKVRGAEDGVENMGSLCVKGRFGYDWVNSPERLTTPLIRRGDGFEAASWDEALDIVASRFREIKDEHGKEVIAGLASAKCTNEENYIFQKFVRTCFGNNNVDHCARLCHAPTVEGLVKAFGSGAMTNSILELKGSDVIFVTGSNTTENHPVIAKYMRQAVVDHGATLIVVDPRKIGLVDHAKIWLRQRGGTDVALLNGLMNVILRRGLHDTTFIEERCEGFQELKETVVKYTPERVEEITGVPSREMEAAATAIGEADRASFVFSMGITQHTTGTDNVMSVANLAMLTGSVGRECTGVNPLRGQNNVQGACDLGALPNVYPGYQSVNDEQIRSKFTEAWGVDLSAEPGLTVVEMIDAAYEGKLKCLYVMGENPMLSDPDLNHVEDALGNLEFLVVQDIFMSETAELADVVLPAASFAEKDGTFTNTGRRVQRVNKLFEPVGEARADWEIICELAARTGYPMGYESPSEIMDEIAGVTPIYGGVGYDRLGREGVQWPCTDATHPGTRFLHAGRFTRGKGRFHAVEYKPPAEEPDDEYPFMLTTGRVLEHFHTGTMTRRSEVLDALIGECLVEVNPEDAARIGVIDGDTIRVRSRRGCIEAKARVTEKSAPGSVFIPFHFAEAAANKLTNAALDPYSKIPEYKVCAVAIEMTRD
jgi:formate dehydrogenase alpha subunit